MNDPVKPRRRYDASLRRQSAERTRIAMLDAAQRRFDLHGWAGTTVADVAQDAGVSTRTVYLAFGTKAGLVRALWNHQLRGGRDEVPVAEQPWYREMLAEPDPQRRLRRNAANSRRFKERAGGLLEVVRDGAATDAEVAELWERINTEYRANQRVIVAGLAERSALAPGLDVERAADILWTLNHPDVWLLLAGRRGWTPDEFEQWLGDASCALLLGRPAV